MIRNTGRLCNLKLLWSICSLLFSCQHCPQAEGVLSLSSASPLLSLWSTKQLSSSAARLGLQARPGSEMWMGDVLQGNEGACPCLSRCWGRNGWDRTNSSPLSCSCTISLLGSGKMEENKENDLGPPLPQSYAATVARQSTVPSTSTMPGKHRVCPISAICQNATWGKVESLPTCQSSTRNTTCAMHMRPAGLSGAPQDPQNQAKCLLLCVLGAVAGTSPPRAELSHKQAHWQGRNHIRASQFVRQQLQPGGFPGAEPLAVEVRFHWSCGKIATDSLKLLDLTPTKLALSCCRRRLGDYLSHYIPEFKGPCTDVDLALKAVLTFPVDGRRKAPAPGGSRVVQSLTCAVNGDTFLFRSPPKLC